MSWRAVDRSDPVHRMLLQPGGVAVVVADERHGAVVFQVGHGAVLVLTYGQEERIAGLRGVHHLAHVLEPETAAVRVVERQVYVLGIFDEYPLQILLQQAADLEVGLHRQLGRELRGDVGHELELVIEVEVRAAFRHILVHEVAAGEGCRPEDADTCQQDMPEKGHRRFV